MKSNLKCINVSKYFRNNNGFKNQEYVLKDIKLEIKENDFITILGPSGTGKSTLLKLLGGFLKPSTGTIYFNNKKLEKITPLISMVFQDHTLFPWLNVEENVAFGFDLKGLRRKDYRDKVNESLEQVGLFNSKNLFPHQLSGGMKQRVSLARSLAVDSEILLLDEPFSALDIQLRRNLQKLLLSIRKDYKKSMVLVTHNVEEAILLGSKLILLEGKPAIIKNQIDVSCNSYSDRYSQEFLALQKDLETKIEFN